MPRPRTVLTDSRRGSSYLEIQVAMVLMSIAVGGLYSLSVIHTRQTTLLRQQLPSDAIASLNPATGASETENAWRKKLGVYASIDSDTLVPLPTTYPLHLGFAQVINGSDSVAVSTTSDPDGYDWVDYTYSLAYRDDIKLLFFFSPTATSSTVQYDFTGIAPGEYEVAVASSPWANFGSTVPHQIYDGGTLIDTVYVDQTIPQNDFTWDSHPWKRLGVYTFHSNQISIRVLDARSTGYFIAADAALVRCRRSVQMVSPVSRSAGGGASTVVEVN